MATLPNYSIVLYIRNPYYQPLWWLGFIFYFWSGVGGLISCHPEPWSSGDGSSVPRCLDKTGGTVSSYCNQVIAFFHFLFLVHTVNCKYVTVICTIQHQGFFSLDCSMFILSHTWTTNSSLDIFMNCKLKLHSLLAAPSHWDNMLKQHLWPQVVVLLKCTPPACRKHWSHTKTSGPRCTINVLLTMITGSFPRNTTKVCELTVL